MFFQKKLILKKAEKNLIFKFNTILIAGFSQMSKNILLIKQKINKFYGGPVKKYEAVHYFSGKLFAEKDRNWLIKTDEGIDTRSNWAIF